MRVAAEIGADELVVSDGEDTFVVGLGSGLLENAVDFFFGDVATENGSDVG